MGQLVRYIHLNPVKAGMVAACEDYPYSSHRAYLDMEAAGIIDVDPVLRLFGVKRPEAAQRFAQYVNGARDYDEAFTLSDGGRILGSEEFVDAAIHRIGDTGMVYKPTDGRLDRKLVEIDEAALIASTEQVFELPRQYFVGSGNRHRNAVFVKEVLLASGCRIGASLAALSRLVGLNTSTASRRHDSARLKQENDENFKSHVSRVVKQYHVHKCN